ncbi:purine and uridine phosphorylase [Aspergillus californicus]
MSKYTPRLEDYAIGWISALRIEYVAALELLDEEHVAPSNIPSHDENAYRFGRIGHHNIVLSCMPKGKYGVTSAASVANHMLRSFPNLRIGLMVGIGGGAPTKMHDIRLGDVVVSTPTGQRGGVIHYNFGKAIQDKTFQQTGQLNSSPLTILNCLHDIETLHERRGHDIDSTVTDMIQANNRLIGYQRPDPMADVLYDSSFVHSDNSQDCASSCIRQKDKIVHRSNREPDHVLKVHYGLIASADHLMKDAHVRDHLAETEDVLCFEMEAAGLMDRFPCVVIRGICDYSDTHKNDKWQKYAAATAAAYAKELLGVIRR